MKRTFTYAAISVKSIYYSPGRALRGPNPTLKSNSPITNAASRNSHVPSGCTHDFASPLSLCQSPVRSLHIGSRTLRCDPHMSCRLAVAHWASSAWLIEVGLRHQDQRLYGDQHLYRTRSRGIPILSSLASKTATSSHSII